MINYAEGASDDDNFGIESDDDEEFTAIGERGGRRRGLGAGAGGGRSGSVSGGVSGGSRVGSPGAGGAGGGGLVRAELDKSYLGMVPPSRFISSKFVSKTRHEYPLSHPIYASP